MRRWNRRKKLMMPHSKNWNRSSQHWITSNIISMFWNATTCQKRKIPGRKKAQNDNTAPASDAVYSSITGTGAFLFWISGAARRSNDAGIRHNHRASALVFSGLGAESTNKFLQKLITMHCLPQLSRIRDNCGYPEKYIIPKRRRKPL